MFDLPAENGKLPEGQDQNSSSYQVERLQHMTAILKDQRTLFADIPVRFELDEPLIEYSVALSYLATAAHRLSRLIYLERQKAQTSPATSQPQPASQLSGLAAEMKKKGITIEMLTRMIQLQKQQEGIDGATSRS